jgi:hypothetical protein
VYRPFLTEGSQQLTLHITGYVLVATPDSYVAVEAVVRNYIDAWHAGDEHWMERSLHDDLVKRSVDNNASAPTDLSPVTKTQMVQLTRGGGGDSPGAHADVVIHHVEAEIATAQVATAEYLDYLHLVRVGGTWRIVHDLFRQWA